MSDFKIDDEFTIIDSKGSEYTFDEYCNQGIKQIQIQNLSLKEEVRNSICKILMKHGYEDFKSFDIAHLTSEFVIDNLK